MKQSGLLLYAAYEEYGSYIPHIFEPESECRSIEHVQSQLRGLVGVLNETEGLEDYRLNIVLDLILNGSHGEQAKYSAIVNELDISDSIWKKGNVHRLADHRVIQGIGADKMTQFISSGLERSQQNAVSVLSRTALIDVLSPSSLAGLLEQALVKFPEDAAKVLIARADKIVGKVGEYVAGERLYGNPASKVSKETASNLWEKYCSAASRAKPQSHHLQLVCTAG